MPKFLLFLCSVCVTFASASAQRCDSTMQLGFGDTTKPSDTRFAAQWCRGTRSTADGVSAKSFVPGGGDRIFNNSLSPCEPVQSAKLFCGSSLIAQGSVRPGCPNGRSTLDFCAPSGGGARAIDAACGRRKMTIQATRRDGSTFCYSPPGANITFRNGRLEPNRTQ